MLSISHRGELIGRKDEVDEFFYFTLNIRRQHNTNRSRKMMLFIRKEKARIIVDRHRRRRGRGAKPFIVRHSTQYTEQALRQDRLSIVDLSRHLTNISIKSFATRDEQEVAGYAEVMETVFQSWAHIPLTETPIRQFHRDLLKYSDKDERHRGRYKTAPNHVAAFDADGKAVGIVFETAAPFDTPGRMRELVGWTAEALEEGRFHPLLVIAAFIVEFLAIHPFQDGNGRLSHILTTLLLLRAGYAYVPYSSLESVIEQSKEGYYLALRQTQGSLRTANPIWTPWVVFFLKALERQTRTLQQKIERERLVLPALPELSVRILEQAREHGRVDMAGMVRLTGANRNTLKLHFRRLLANRQLVIRGAGRGAWYTLP